MIDARPVGSACDYCGLPLPESPHPSDEPAFCCFGCRFASGIMRERDDDTTSRWVLTRLGLSIFFTMNVMVFTMAMWSNDVYGEDTGQFSTALYALFRSLCLLFSLPVLVMLGLPLLHHAWQALRHGRLSSELLIVVGVAAAFAFSVVSVLRGDGHVYFEVACMVLVLVTLGRWMEAAGRIKATAAIAGLERLLPESVTQIVHGAEVVAATESLASGDLIRIRAGERFPVDGRIHTGRTTVDEQVFTGESVPIERAPGENVLAGTINLDGDIIVEVTAAARDGSFARLLDLLREARSTRGNYQRMADRVAQWFVPVVAIVAILVFAGHAGRGVVPAVLAALSVVLIACPCALGLATPLAVWTALSHAARHQVLFRNGIALEQLAGVRAVRFDKTGTLTDGSPHVRQFICDSETDRDLCLFLSASLSGASTHVFSRAIRESVLSEVTALPCSVKVTDVRTIAGRGVEGRLHQEHREMSMVRLGSAEFAGGGTAAIPEEIREGLQSASIEGTAIVLISWQQRLRGLFLIDEQLRPRTADAIHMCRSLGLDLGALTGDRPERAVGWSKELGIPFSGRLSPADKVEHIRLTRREVGATAMVGDGINDAPALAASDVGIALGCGADVTRDSASVCVMSNDLRSIPWAIELSRRTRRIVRQNLAWAFGYNSIGIALAAGGWLNPAIAAGLMVVSSVIVIVNSMRLGLSTDASAGDGNADSGPSSRSASSVPMSAGQPLIAGISE